MMKFMNLALVLIFAGLLPCGIFADNERASTIRFSGVPVIGFGDAGVGGGIIGNLYVDEEGYEPYKMSVGIKAYITNKLVNSHMIKIDRLNAFSLPWRLIGRVGFYSTPVQNYCGLASDARCDMEVARSQAAIRGYSGEEADVFAKRYYQNRYMSIYNDIFSSWLLWQGSAKLSLINSYRGAYYWNRDFKDAGPYEGSLYQRDFGNSRQNGYLSTLEAGLMLDNRDSEPAPTSGYWLEGTVRGAAKFTGSAWSYFGANVSARFYIPFDDAHKLVFASQSVVDTIVGDLPYDAMSRIGGSQALNDHNAFGGQYMGRGIREQRYVGRFKAIEQLEVRYNFWSFMLWKQNFDFTAAAFGDVAMTAWDYQRFAKDMKVIHLGFGPGLRISWNKTFIIRADMGLSPAEDFSPQFYLIAGNIF